MPKITLKRQIKAVEKEIVIMVRSYTHRLQLWEGRIPPGKDLTQLNALKAALLTLKSLNKRKNGSRTKT